VDRLCEPLATGAVTTPWWPHWRADDITAITSESMAPFAISLPCSVLARARNNAERTGPQISLVKPFDGAGTFRESFWADEAAGTPSSEFKVHSLSR
jgi:hypothetical protein